MSGDELPGWILTLWPVVWPFLGGVGGAIVSLGLTKNENLTPRKKAFNVLVGTIIAVFVGPLVVRYTLGTTTRADSEMVGAIYCLVGLSATSLMERVVTKIAALLDMLPLGRRKESE